MEGRAENCNAAAGIKYNHICRYGNIGLSALYCNHEWGNYGWYVCRCICGLGQIFDIMNEIVSKHIGSMNRDMGKINNFLHLLDMPDRTGSISTPDFTKGVTAYGISYTYPGRENPAVKDVSLNLAEGETIAIVGENGAGKSTLVRLLTGIYRPLEGRVIIGGLDTAKIAPSLYIRAYLAYFRNISGTK